MIARFSVDTPQCFTSVDKKEDSNTPAVEELEDGYMAEEVAVAHRRILGEGVMPIHEITMKLL